jgi:outer membrane biosynthesis protein TonB
MEDNFESKKNLRAGGYTALVCSLLLLIFLFVRWSLPPLAEPPVEEGIEVNLGSSDAGMGDDQPFEPGSPAPAEQQAYTPPAPAPVEAEPAKEMVEDNEPDAPVIKKPTVTKPDATKTPEKEVVKSKPVKNPVVTPAAPAVVKPKAVFKGVNGTGTGGNEADSYKKGGNQGIAGGQGDQGRPGGNPDSDNYTGGGKGGGVSISRGLQGRRITGTPSFQDDFNENAKISVDIKVDATGKVISAVYQPRGSTTSDAGLIEIAKRKAFQVKFSAGGEESVGTLQFNFKLKS